MERYERYKDSGVKWIGEIPGHWGMYKLKYLFKLNKNKNIGNKCNTILSLSYGKIKIKKDLNEGLTPESYESYQLLSTGDIVIRSTDLQNDHTSLRTGLVKIEGAITSAYIGLKNLDMSLCDSRFYHYFLHDWDITKAIYNQGKGLRQSLNWDDIKNMLMPVIDISEQTAIANYLDSVTSIIDEAISQQQKMIDLLNERKQIIIQNAVTKGLDPNAKMKDSGVEWIGEIPEHWEVIKLKYIFRRIADGTHFSPETIEEGMPYITATDVRGKGIDFNETKKIRQKDYEALVAAGCKPQLNDILLVKDGATTGRVGLMIDDTDCVTLSSVAMLSPQKKYSHLYLMYMMMSDFMQKQILLSMAGAAMPRITLIKLSNFIGIVPPMDEQESIVTYMEKASMPIDSAIKSAEKQIFLLQERKQIIINDVVTGKVKVV